MLESNKSFPGEMHACSLRRKTKPLFLGVLLYRLTFFMHIGTSCHIKRKCLKQTNNKINYTFQATKERAI